MKGKHLMSNLITSGVSFALISADSYSKLATKPMNMASRELAKANPDMGYVNRTMGYGVKELGKAEKLADETQEELVKAQEIANAEEKAENEARLNEPKPDTPVEKVATAKEVSNADKVAATHKDADETVVDTGDSSSTHPPKVDTIEISADAMIQLANNQSQKIAIDLPKKYTPNGIAVGPNIAPQPQKIDARV